MTLLATAFYDARPGETEFMDRAECRKYPPVLWDTLISRHRTVTRNIRVDLPGENISREAANNRARRICGDCPVRLECLRYVTRHPQEQGIWAGLLPEERKARCRPDGAPPR